MNIQAIELGIIRSETDELREVLLALANHEFSGYLSLALSPTTGFVTEESHNYLLSRNLINDSSSLFTNYKAAVKKSRALLKLFDDTDGGMNGLIELLLLFQNKTTQWMNVGRRGLFGSLIRKFLQPDNGIYFLDEDPIYMSIVGFSAGKTKQEIEALSENDFEGFPEQAKSYGFSLGEYFGTIAGVLNYYGISTKLESSKEISLNAKITHNDVHSNKFYQLIANEANLEIRIAPAFFFILSQVNIAYALLPRLLSSNSSLLARLQFLSIYHATRSLLEIRYIGENELARWLANNNILSIVPNVRKVRNFMAHYGLGVGKKFVGNNPDTFDDVIKGLCGFSKLELLEISNTLLREISEWTRRKFSKTQLKSVRALLGDHT